MNSSRNHLYFGFLKTSFIFISLVSLFSCTSILPECNSCSSPPLASLHGEWELLRWNLPPSNTGEVRLRGIPHGDNGEPIKIRFDQEKKMISGYSGCNRFFSALEIESNNAIKIGNIGSTKMMCMGNFQMDLERDFLNQLSDYRSWKQQGNELLLVGKTGDVLVFGRRN